MVLKASMRIVPVHEGSRRTTVLHSAIEKPAIPRKAFSVMDRTACAILQSEGVIGSPGSENGQTRRYAFIRVAALARKP